MPYDFWSALTLVASAALFICAYAAPSHRTAFRLTLILLAALLIRVDAAAQLSLHAWDERFHALVAKHLMVSPFRPVLYAEAPLPYDIGNWRGNHIWLHKPPVALWLMAASMNLFGVSEIVARIPSLVLSTATVYLTYATAALFFEKRVALLAAAFGAVNGFLVSLAAGRRVADHVDTALVFFVQLAIYFALRHGLSRTANLLSVGAACGVGFLAKSVPALLALPVICTIAWQQGTLVSAVRRCVVVTAVAAVVVAPWALYTAAWFPAESAWTAQYTAMHMRVAVEGQESRWSSYLTDLGRFFGETTYVALVYCAVVVGRSPRGSLLTPFVVWFAVPYATFSAMATRLPAYVMIAAPAIFVLEAWFWIHMVTRARELPRWQALATRVFLAAALVLPAKYLLEPTGPMEVRERQPSWSLALKGLTPAVSEPRTVVFNVSRPIEAMFYWSCIAYERMPTDDEVRALVRDGWRVAILQNQPFAVPADWNVTRLTTDEPSLVTTQDGR